MGITELWCSKGEFENEVLESEDPQAALEEAVAREESCEGQLAPLSETCGNPTRDKNGRVIGCEAMRVTIFSTERSDALNDEFKGLAQGARNRFDSSVSVVWSFPFFMEEEIRKSIDEDLHLWAVSYALVYFLLGVSQARETRCESRPILSLLGVVTVALGNASGYGLLIASGKPMGNLEFLLPYLIVAIGVDDILIFLESLRASRANNPNASVEEHIMSIMDEAGLSTAVRSVEAFPDIAFFFFFCRR